MTAIQLDPTIPLLTPKGSGSAIFMIDYGPEHHLLWVVIDDATGEIWSWPNPQVRGERNISMGRPNKPTIPKA